MSAAVSAADYRPRRGLLARGETLIAFLRYYEGAAAQPTHIHDDNQVSFLLLGAMQERQGVRDFDPAAGWVGFKPAGCAHADRFGPDGALILAIETRANESLDRAGWAVHADGKARAALTRLAVDTSGSALALDAIHDLLSSACHKAEVARGSPPAALARARAQLQEQPERCRIDMLAESAGIERTMFARLFRSHFGLPPSIFRAKQMATKATRVLLDDSRTVADAAFAAGFADHAHYTKTLRRFTGLTPQQLRAALT